MFKNWCESGARKKQGKYELKAIEKTRAADLKVKSGLKESYIKDLFEKC